MFNDGRVTSSGTRRLSDHNWLNLGKPYRDLLPNVLRWTSPL